MPDAFLCPPDKASDGDRATVANFQRMLAGERGCLVCLVPDGVCDERFANALGKCCADCVHGTLPKAGRDASAD